jgi:hypothetical protein
MVHEAYQERHFGMNEHRSERPRSVADMLESEETSRALLERARWPEGPVCPGCGAKNARRAVAASTASHQARISIARDCLCRSG